MTRSAMRTHRGSLTYRPEPEPADYRDEISDQAFAKLKETLAEENDPKRKRRIVSCIPAW
ncbi:MAG: hypothetical protein ACRC67_33170 [Inquilinus sp.]|uniref:hypothetical protein n=1 Tax=Inquilinus sp. TaxID=1932117 RepID=UPI003F387F79